MPFLGEKPTSAESPSRPLLVAVVVGAEADDAGPPEDGRLAGHLGEERAQRARVGAAALIRDRVEERLDVSVGRECLL